MFEKQDQSASIAQRFRKYIEISAMVTFSALTVILFLFPKFTTGKVVVDEYIPPIENIDIPPEIQTFEKPPPPVRPTIPIESESEEIDDDLAIYDTGLDDFQVWDAPPPLPAPDIKFVPFTEAPEPIGGYGVIQRNVVYPEIALEAGIEGIVTIEVSLSAQGDILGLKVLKGVPNTGLDEAALDAIRRTKFKPGYQRDKAVPVQVSIPIRFKLKE